MQKTEYHQRLTARKKTAGRHERNASIILTRKSI